LEVRNNQNILTLGFDSKVDYKIFAYYNNIFSISKNNIFLIIELNFSKTIYITLPGAMYLLLIVSAIVNYKIKIGLNIETRISNCSENIFNVLSSFGLIDMLKLYGNLKIDAYSNALNENKTRFWKTSVKQTDYNLNSIFWPIAIIPVKEGSSFEDEIKNFFNGFTTHLWLIIKYGFINNLNIEKIEFIKKDYISAINEATKNVWDHSESWGIASIYSNRYQKTTFCIFDYGIGFINSYVKRKPSSKRTLKTDIQILNWLFKEGNTSDEINNHGRGLAKIAKFTDNMKGTLLIRTDKYMLKYDCKNGLIIFEKTYFPGTQIMLNF